MTNLSCEIPHSDIFLFLAGIGTITLTLLFMLAAVGGWVAVQGWFRS